MEDMDQRVKVLSSNKRAMLAKKLLEKQKQTDSRSIPRLNRNEAYTDFPLSFVQQRIWFLSQLEKDAATYNGALAVRLKGNLNVDVFYKSLQFMIQRHEIFRTVYIEVDDQPIQRVLADMDITLPIEDLSLHERVEQEEMVINTAIREERRQFDLENGPLVSFKLLKLSENEFVFIFGMHHILYDGWSVGLFRKELAVIYNAFLEGKTPELPELRIQYADFAVWQRKILEGELFVKQMNYWKKKLKNCISLLELPAPSPRPPVHTHNGDCIEFYVRPEVTKALKELSAMYGCTLYATLLAAFKGLLYRYSNQEDIIVGTPIANRSHSDLKNIFGCFVNKLALRTNMSGNPRFTELMEKVKNAALEAYDHQDLPFEKIVDEVHAVRDLSHTPIYQVNFSLDKEEKVTVPFKGLVQEEIDIQGGSAKFDIYVLMTDLDEGIQGKLNFYSDLFDRPGMEQMIRHFQKILEEVSRNPLQTIENIPLLSKEEEKMLLQGWNDTKVDFAHGRTVYHMFEEQALKYPKRAAVYFEGGSYTYSELNQRANKLANWIISKGVCADSKVALFMERSLDIMVGLLGILKAGCAYVPIDSSYPKDRISYMLDEVNAKIMVTQSDIADELGEVEGVDTFCIDSQWEKLGDMSDENPGLNAVPSDTAYVIFTSGSTGKPKGVAIEHRNISNYVQALLKRLDVPDGLSYAIVTTFAADLGLTSLWGALCSGGSLHVISYERAADPDAFAEYFRNNSIDVLKIVPSHFEALNVIDDLRDIIPNKWLIFGGEASNWELIAGIHELKPQCRIMNHYGPTETTVGMLTYKIEDRDYETGKTSVPLGKPLGNTYAYILDSHMQPVPVGVPGELYIGGDGVSRGYINRSELTLEKFVPDPFSEKLGSRLYRTGDLTRFLQEGNIEFLGRIDNQVKIRGYRIEIGEIETLIKNHHDIKDAVVIVREDKLGDKRLVAYLVPETGHEKEFPAGNLREFLKANLPDYMVPTVFVTLDVIPLNANGKVDRHALPIPLPEHKVSGEGFIAPRNEMEINIAKIWSDVLEVDKVGVDDNFFDLGGDSFKAIKVVRSISSSLGVMELFRNPTVRELSNVLSKGKEKNTKHGLLQELTKHVPVRDKVVSLVCIPYGGASAITYQTLANTLPKNYSLYAVDQPGHDFSRPDERLESVETVAERCVAEIKQKIKGPIVIFGHCVGGSLALAISMKLEEEGIKVDGVFMGGIFPSPRLSSKMMELWNSIFNNRKRISEKAFSDMLRSVGGINDSISKEEGKFIIRNLRHDAIENEEFFTKLYSEQKIKRINVPITCIIGGGDRMTEFYQERYKDWETFSDQVDLRVIGGAGHYFHKYQSKELADIIVEKVDCWQGRKEYAVEEKKEEDARGKKKVVPSMPLFLAVTIGQIISAVGSTLSTFGMGIWVYHKTGAVSNFAMIFLFSMLPTILLLPFSGALADRLDKRKIMLACDAFAAFATSIMLLMLFNNQLLVWHTFVFASISAAANAFRRPAYMASIAQITPKIHLLQANAVSQFANAIGAISAPIIGGVLILTIGFKGVVLIDLISFIAAIAVLLSVKFPDAMFSRMEEPIMKEIAGGWNYIMKRKSLIAMVVFFVVVNFLMSSFDVLLAPMVLSYTSTAVLGLISAAQGLGLFVGSLAMSILGGFNKRSKGMVGFAMLAGASIAISALRPSPIAAGIGLFGFGVAVALMDTHWSSLIQVKVGLELQGRVFSINQMMAFSMRPLSYILAGLAADKVFEPSMAMNGGLAGSIGGILGTGAGRGMALMAIIEGGLLIIWTIIGLKYKPLSDMDKLLPDAYHDGIIIKDKDKLQELEDKRLEEKACGDGNAA